MWTSILLLVIISILLILIGILIKIISIQLDKQKIYERWIVSLQNQAEGIQKTITMLDDKQMFSRDDEVGVVFQQIADLIKSLNVITTRQ